MTTWLLLFPPDQQQAELWLACLQFGVAALTYAPLATTDLAKHPPGEPRALWARLAPGQKISLHRLAYEMQAGDGIYLAQGSQVVGKGDLRGGYQFDAKFRLLDPTAQPWAHQVPVTWALDFPAIKIRTCAKQLVVKKLSPACLHQLEVTTAQVHAALQQQEAHTAQAAAAEATFRRQHRALIQAKQAHATGCCEVCGFDFEEAYGLRGRAYLIAHPLKLPLAAGAAKTTLADIVLLCANCHAMAHTQPAPRSLKALRKLYHEAL